LTDPALADRFAPLRAELIDMLGRDNMIITTQRYLADGLNIKVALKGGGISAMPSMHIATATIYLLAARRTRWLWPALLFLLLTFFGSVYLGYHYAIDAPVAAIVAAGCWSVACRFYPSATVGTRQGKVRRRLASA
jgi:membrane-associated phospholipid phosphatase